MDSTGLREDDAFTTLKRKNWRKLIVIVDTDPQMILPANISIGPRWSDSKRFEMRLILSCEELLVDSGDCR